MNKPRTKAQVDFRNKLLRDAGYATPELATRASKLIDLIGFEILRNIAETSMKAHQEKIYNGNDAPSIIHIGNIYSLLGLDEKDSPYR